MQVSEKATGDLLVFIFVKFLLSFHKFVKVKVMKGVIVIVEMAKVKGQNNRSKCACHNKEVKGIFVNS